MASNQKTVLMLEQTVTTTAEGSPKGFQARDEDFVFEVAATKESGTGDLTISIQHSHDKVNWYEVVNFGSPALSTTGTKTATPAAGVKVLQWLKAVATESATADYTVTVNAYYRKRD